MNLLPLDTETAGQIAQSLKQIAAGQLLIVATHDAELASSMDRVIAMSVVGVNTHLDAVLCKEGV